VIAYARELPPLKRRKACSIFRQRITFIDVAQKVVA
jgi:hypothetical protein